MKTSIKKVTITNRQGESITGRRIEITGDFDVNIDEFWINQQRIESLIEICKPIIYFKSYSNELPSQWDVGKDYKFKLVDINARGLTYLIALGAVCFYKHRQRKWKKLHRDMP